MRSKSRGTTSMPDQTMSEPLDGRHAAYTHQELKEAQHTNDTKDVSGRCHDGSESWERGVHHWTKEDGDNELHKEDCSIPYNRTESNDGDSDQRVWRKLASRIGEGLDENVGNGKQHRHHDGEDDLGKDDRSPTCAWSITRHFI